MIEIVYINKTISLKEKIKEVIKRAKTLFN
jgi:hypothetical protein|nr:MAG TPA: hypothetical protein [Caudoviricetes sp.]